MGNWRRVHIQGSCDYSEIQILKSAITYNRNTLEGFHCLVNGGICGLPNWASESINAVGNLAERDYDEFDIEEALLEISVKVPSLSVKVHLGNDNESNDCVNTIILNNGSVEIKDPEVSKIPEISESQMAMQQKLIFLLDIK